MSTASSVPSGSSPSRARLLERRDGLAQPQIEIGGHQTRDDLTAANGGAEIDEHLLEPAGDFEAEDDLFLGRQRAGDRHGPVEQGRFHAHDLDRHRVSRAVVGPRRGRGGPVTGRSRHAEQDE